MDVVLTAQLEPLQSYLQQKDLVELTAVKSGQVGLESAGSGYQWCEAKQKCQRFWEEPCTDDDLVSCETDTDCIPLPSECHPRTCINKMYEGNYVKPEICTMLYDPEAAYNPEDCLCQENKCVNKNS